MLKQIKHFLGRFYENIKMGNHQKMSKLERKDYGSLRS